VTESRLSLRTAAPLKRPAFFASFTVPVITDPAGMTILPPMLIGVAIDPVNAVPTWLLLDPSASPVRIVRTVPSETITGFGGGGGGRGVRSAAGCTSPGAGVVDAPISSDSTET